VYQVSNNELSVGATNDTLFNEKIRELISNGDIDIGGTHRATKNVSIIDFYIEMVDSIQQDFHSTPQNIKFNVISNPLSKVITGSFMIDCITTTNNE
jgi:hypothetical protein